MPLHCLGRVESCTSDYKVYFASDNFDSEEFLLNDLKKFHNVTKKNKNDVLMLLSIKLAFHKFKLSQRTPIIHLCNLFERPIDINWSENPGLPWILNGLKTKNDIRNDSESIGLVRKFWHYIKLGENTEFPDCIPSATDNKNSMEVKWIYPGTINFGEAMFAFPILQCYKSLTYRKTPLIQVFKKSENGVEMFKERFERDSLFYYVLKFPNFHKTVPAWLIDMAFDILCIQVDMAHYDDYGIPDARYMYRMFKKIKGYFINTTYRTPNGNRYKKNNGIPLESYFAPLICPVINRVILNYAILKTGGMFFYDTIFLGYGSLVTTTFPLDINGIKSMLQTFGIDLDVKCSKVTRNIDDLDLVNILNKSF